LNFLACGWDWKKKQWATLKHEKKSAENKPQGNYSKLAQGLWPPMLLCSSQNHFGFSIQVKHHILSWSPDVIANWWNQTMV
jgi:hypothetical protein